MVVFKVGFVLFGWFFLLTRLHECHKTTIKKMKAFLGTMDGDELWMWFSHSLF